MMIRCLIVVMAALAVMLPAARADGPLADGYYRLLTVSAVVESPLMVLKVETAGGKSTATIAAMPEPPASAKARREPPLVQEIKQEGNEVIITFSTGARFYGRTGGDAKTILGGYGTATFLNRAKLVATDSAELPRPTRITAPEAFTQAQQLASRPVQLRMQAQREQDEGKKKELLGQVPQAQKEADEKVPALYREVIEKHGDTLAAMDAAQTLLASAARFKISPDEAAKYLKVIEARAKPYGQRYVELTMQRLGSTLVTTKGLESAALPLIEPAAKALKDTDPAARQVQVLTEYSKALTAVGRTDEAKAITARLDRLDAALDKEYRSTVPSFKPTAFGGRKDTKANQVVLFELFTGAQCPPCVAADVAFDVLTKSYKPNELVLVQYHLHIPGPDPLANKDSYARWDYYRESFQQEMRGVPSSVFNGKPRAGGGGSMEGSARKYDQYREIIDKDLEQVTPVSLTGSAKRDSDKIDIAVNVNGVEPGADVKLRLLLVEEEIKYVGSNRIRFHHHVVRDMPGGPAGVELKEKSLSHKATVDLAELRKELTSYLDDYAANTRPFLNDKRPMDFKHLKVIAFIQNDKTREVHQAALIDIESKDTAAK
jgi:hypothetical protein